MRALMYPKTLEGTALLKMCSPLDHVMCVLSVVEQSATAVELNLLANRYYGACQRLTDIELTFIIPQSGPGTTALLEKVMGIWRQEKRYSLRYKIIIVLLKLKQSEQIVSLLAADKFVKMVFKRGQNDGQLP